MEFLSFLPPLFFKVRHSYSLVTVNIKFSADNVVPRTLEVAFKVEMQYFPVPHWIRSDPLGTNWN